MGGGGGGEKKEKKKQGWQGSVGEIVSASNLALAILGPVVPCFPHREYSWLTQPSQRSQGNHL